MQQATVQRTIDAPRDAVWEILTDAGSYPRWVVGARAFRGADAAWPQPDAAFYHAVGLGPLQLKDLTRLVEREDGRRIVLEARALPAGRAQVALTLAEAPTGTRVVMGERAVAGPMSRVPQRLHDALVKPRNRAGLRRLERLVSEHVS